ncbi:MAG: hypothetical protein D6832_01785 [Alphaproteobacteria bacterium]|nr:MAG: hypothetical protein D6832_01785 [Alphaproteobacteria bacterium]
MKKLMMAAALGALTAAPLAPAALAEGKTHYVAFHVDQNDPKVMNMTLNNVKNVTRYFKKKGDEVVIEVVAYGPGLNMYIPGKSPVEQRISTMALEMDNITFSACGNTKRKMEKKIGHELKLLDEAQVVPSGVARLVELSEQGYVYIRP